MIVINQGPQIENKGAVLETPEISVDSLREEANRLKEKAEKEVETLVEEIKKRWGLQKTQDFSDLNRTDLSNKFSQIESDLKLDSLEEDKKTEIQNLLKDIEFHLEQYENLVEVIMLSNRELPSDITSLNTEQKKQLHTTYEYKGEDDDTAIINLDKESQIVLAEVEEILKDNEFPNFSMGSAAATLYMSFDKKPKDLDRALGLPDFPKNYAVLKEKEREGVIKNLQIVAISDIENGEKNGCFELRFDWILDDKTLKECSFFYNNVKNQEGDIKDNGILSAGYKEQSVSVYYIINKNGEKVPSNFTSQESSEYLYIYNFLTELSVFKLKNFIERGEKYPWVTPKALFRLNNLINLSGGDFEKITNTLRRVINDEQNETIKNKFKRALVTLNKIKKDYKTENQKAESTDGGLKEELLEEFSLDKGSNTDALIDAFNKQMIKEMNETHNIMNNATSEYNEFVKSGEFNESNINDFLSKLEGYFGQVSSLQKKYKDYLDKVNYSKMDDFTFFTGIKILEEDFFTKAGLNIIAYEYKLKTKLQELKEE